MTQLRGSGHAPYSKPQCLTCCVLILVALAGTKPTVLEDPVTLQIFASWFRPLPTSYTLYDVTVLPGTQQSLDLTPVCSSSQVASALQYSEAFCFSRASGNEDLMMLFCGFSISLPVSIARNNTRVLSSLRRIVHSFTCRSDFLPPLSSNRSSSGPS